MGWGAHSAEERTIAFFLKDVNGSLWQSGTRLFEGLEACFEIDKIELEVEVAR
jgi:hypothetical protein